MIDIILYSAFCIDMIYIVRTVKGMITFFAYIHFFLLRDTPKKTESGRIKKDAHAYNAIFGKSVLNYSLLPCL